MRIKDLKKMIENLPDDMHVVTSGRDHSYRIVNADVVEAIDCDGHLTEYYWDGDDDGDDKQAVEKVTEVLCVD